MVLAMRRLMYATAVVLGTKGLCVLLISGITDQTDKLVKPTRSLVVHCFPSHLRWNLKTYRSPSISTTLPTNSSRRKNSFRTVLASSPASTRST